MSLELEVGLYIFMLAGFLGYHLITRVPPLLHTPLMSATNAMSGISLVGSLVVAGSGHGALSTVFGFIAVACSTTNVVGGFLITDRMLKMFKREQDRAAGGKAPSLRWAIGGGLFLLLGLLVFWGWSSEGKGSLHGADFGNALRFSYIL